MNAVFTLGALLKKHNLCKRGVAAEIVEYFNNRGGVNRQTVAGWIDGHAKAIQLSHLSVLCQWLRDKAVPLDELPASLFGLLPAGLWRAVAETGHVWIIMGQFVESANGESSRAWVSLRDSGLQNEIVTELYGIPGTRDGNKLKTIYVPFHFTQNADGARRRYIVQDLAPARQALKECQTSDANAAWILLGSQEVNFGVEIEVARLFQVEPFRRIGGRPRVPIYMLFRHRDPDLTSCFGGNDPPPGLTGEQPPGLYYLGKDGNWVCCPWSENLADACMVIVVHTPYLRTVELVMFGFTGRATAAMADHVVRKAESFWPPYCHCGDKDVGIYLCKFEAGKQQPADGTSLYQGRSPQILRVDPGILRTYIHA